MQDRVWQDEEPGCSAPDEGDFYFVAEVLALDLINTEVMGRGKRKDLLATGADAVHWLGAARRRYGGEATAAWAGSPCADAAAFREQLVLLRDTLRGIFGALVDSSLPPLRDLDCLNAVLASGYQMLEVAPGGWVRPVYRSRDGASGGLLLPIALSALWLVAEGDRKRLHRCDNGRCMFFFYDTTKSATRRWCCVGCKDRDRKMKQYHALPRAGSDC